MVADFPHGFSDAAAKRLLSIAATGGRCGVYTLIHWDTRQDPPQDLAPDDLRAASVTLRSKSGGGFSLIDPRAAGAMLNVDPGPPTELAASLVHRIGQSSVDSSRVEVPFSHVVPDDDAYWSMDTTHELRVPIGRTGATKLQQLAMGKGTCQHALIAGKTGSGKSTLFHVAITNLALWGSPDEVEFYLVDFKKGLNSNATPPPGSARQGDRDRV